MAGQRVGYARVSSYEQNLDRQLESLDVDELFTEKQSGKNTADRPQLSAMMKYCRKGDEVHVHSIDRLARNLPDLQTIVEKLTAQGVSVHFHKENLVFTGKNDPLSMLMFQMMGAFAQFERSLIKERQMEGIKAAQKRGVKFGRKRQLTDEQAEQLRGEAVPGSNKTELAKKYGISRQSLYMYLK